MNDKQALATAQTRWGQAARIEIRTGGYSTPESRAAAREKLDQLARTGANDKLHDDLFSELHARYRYTVGSVGLGLFFHVVGAGDTWDEAFAEAESKEYT
jgi:hypothetical protein